MLSSTANSQHSSVPTRKEDVMARERRDAAKAAVFSLILLAAVLIDYCM